MIYFLGLDVNAYVHIIVCFYFYNSLKNKISQMKKAWERIICIDVSYGQALVPMLDRR